MSDFPALTAALERDIPALVIDQWQNLAAPHRASGEYAASLSFAVTYPYSGDPLAVAIANTAKHARWLEEGHGAVHLPSVIDWSGPNVHTSKRGVRYLRIPFRHRTPGTTGVSSAGARSMMSTSVYRDALATIRGGRERRQAAVARLAAAGPQMSKVYDERLFPNADERSKAIIRDLHARTRAELGAGGYTWASPKYEGLTHRAQRGAGGRESGAWQTIRTLTEDSLGWLIPPMEGFHFAQRTAEAIRPAVLELLAETGRADFVELIDAEIRALT